MYPAWRARRPGVRQAVLGLDLVLGLLALATAVYLILFEQALYDRGQTFSVGDWVFSTIAVLLAIELARRTSGLTIPIMTVVAITYVAWWGKYASGMFHFPGLTWETVLYRSYYGLDGMFGPIAQISATYVYMFVLFGAFLLRSGAGDFVIDLARVAAGRFVGGPGQVAVLASGLMGSISGSSVANVVTTGVITIPLMKRAGFTPRFAAGVEAAASTGGPLMPPIMGAGAFIMSTYTQISYLAIVAVSFLPAILYFLSVAFWVRIEALKKGVAPVRDDSLSLAQVLRTGGYALLPLVMLIVLLVVGFTPTYAAGVSILAVIAASWLGKTPMGPRAILDALALGARNMVTTGLLLVSVGLVVNAIVTTGIGNTMSLMISDWAGGSLLLTLFLVALAAIVLGLGLPVTATYVILATLSAPALYVLIAQGQLVDLIASGTLPEQAKAIFMLTAPDAVAALGQPMPEARGLGAAGQRAGRVHDAAPPAGAVSGSAHHGTALGAHVHLLAGAGLEHHPAGLHHRLRRRRDRRHPADGDRLHGVDDRQEPLHHAAPVRLHAVPRRRLLAVLVDLRLRHGRHLRAHRGDLGLDGGALVLARAHPPRRYRHRAALADGPHRQRPGLPVLPRAVRLNLWRGRRATATA